MGGGDRGEGRVGRQGCCVMTYDSEEKVAVAYKIMKQKIPLMETTWQPLASVNVSLMLSGNFLFHTLTEISLLIVVDLVKCIHPCSSYNHVTVSQTYVARFAFYKFYYINFLS